MTPCERKILTLLMRIMAEGLKSIGNRELEEAYAELKERRDTFWTVTRFGAAALLIDGIWKGICPKRLGRRLLRAIEEQLDPRWELPHPFTRMKMPVKKHFEEFRKRYS